MTKKSVKVAILTVINWIKCKLGKHEFVFKKYRYVPSGTIEEGYCKHCLVKLKRRYRQPVASRYI